VERRKFVEKFFSFLVLGGIFLLGAGGCQKYSPKELKKFGNEEKLWHLSAGKEKSEEPLELPYAKDTPVLYRDASMGKADPNFVPKITGG